jgi:hypothetical protein
MQKALTVMNLRLTNVLSDITGLTGMQIIRSIVAGERDPQRLAQFRDYRCVKSEEEIAKSLEGHYQAEQVFVLQQAVELYDFYDRQVQTCDQRLKQLYDQFDPPEGTPPPAPRTPKRKHRKAEEDELAAALYRMSGVDLTEIDGVDVLTIEKVLSETGTDMSRWPTEKHFASWLHLCPNNRITGGKVKQTGVEPTQNRASTALRIAASSLKHSDSALGAYYRRMRARSGGPAAVTATAHKLARIMYAMLKHRSSYQDSGAEAYEQQYRDRVLKNLNRQAARLGFHLEPSMPTPRPVVS